jgi:hypothetical protein
MDASGTSLAVFGRFERAAFVRHYGGLGPGSGSYDLVRALARTIRVKSTQVKGPRSR